MVKEKLEPIYFDHAASTPVHPEVVEAMMPFFYEGYGNPSSVHQFGRKAKASLDRARATIAETLCAEPGQIVFTSGGTEADNMALMGIAMSYRDKGNHIITTQIEHHAILHTCAFLEKQGFKLTYLPVDKTGRVRMEDVQNAITDETILISVMYGNNEVGSLQPIDEIGKLAREKGIFMHTDAVQAYGVIPLDVQDLPVDLLSVSAHKINGPKGIGALYIGRNVKLAPLMHGGEQEKKRRAGTENVPGIVGFAKAVEISQATVQERVKKYLEMREAMIAAWKEEGISFYVNGHPMEFLPHIFNVSFPGIETEVMLMNLDMEGISCSSGSACSSGSLEVSHVLKAMCLTEENLQSAIRFSFGMGNTVEQGYKAAKKVAEIIGRLSR